MRKLKICKFSLVSKICYFFGSLSCVSCFLDWLEGGNTWRCGVHIFAFQSRMDFPFLSGPVIRSDVSFLNFERFLFWNLSFFGGAGLPDFGKAFKF